jgi:hypothetical protein
MEKHEKFLAKGDKTFLLSEEKKTVDFRLFFSEQGIIFSHIDDNLFRWLGSSGTSPDEKEVTDYAVAKDCIEISILMQAKAEKFYSELNLTHIQKICVYHYTNGGTLNTDGVTSFFVRDITGDLCVVNIKVHHKSFKIYIRKYSPKYHYSAGDVFYF